MCMRFFFFFFCLLFQDVIKDMKRRFKFMNHQIEQLKDEITVMDHSLVGCKTEKYMCGVLFFLSFPRVVFPV